MNRQLPAIMLFDLDGTIIDSVPDIAVAVNAMRAESNMLPAAEDVVRSWVGQGLSVLMHRALTDDDGGVADAMDHKAAIAVFRRYYKDCCAQQTVVFEGGDALLSWLASTDVRVAIVTNKPTSFAVRIAEMLGIAVHCDLILGAEPDRALKPDPAALLEAVQHLGGGVAWMVGDTTFDRDAAIAAGIPFVGVQLEGNQGRNICDVTTDDEPVFESLADLHAWLRGQIAE